MSFQDMENKAVSEANRSRIYLVEHVTENCNCDPDRSDDDCAEECSAREAVTSFLSREKAIARVAILNDFAKSHPGWFHLSSVYPPREPGLPDILREPIVNIQPSAEWHQKFKIRDPEKKALVIAAWKKEKEAREKIEIASNEFLAKMNADAIRIAKDKYEYQMSAYRAAVANFESYERQSETDQIKEYFQTSIDESEIEEVRLFWSRMCDRFISFYENSGSDNLADKINSEVRKIKNDGTFEVREIPLEDTV